MDADESFYDSVKQFKNGAHIFTKRVNNPQDFGVAGFNSKYELVSITEKPKTFISNFAIIGFYLFDFKVFEYAKQCIPSSRGQLEITDVLQSYLNDSKLSYNHINFFWQDAGTYENLYLANKYWYEKEINA